ncbi:MAG: protein translocase subunit SecD [Clostridia bacterium]
MKKENVLKIILSIIIMLVIVYLAIFGIHIGDKKIVKGIKSIKTGLDISGGVTIVYQASSDNGIEITEQNLKTCEAVIRKRLENKNIFDYIVRSDVSTNQIHVEIPANIKDVTKDPLQAVEGLDKTAKIEFRDEEGNVLISGSEIKTAKYSEDPTEKTGLPSPHVVLEFSEEGTKKFADATEKLIGKIMPIYLDKDLITSPYVNQKIDSNTAIITMGAGDYSEKKAQAQEYAMLIDSGALPFSLGVISKEYIGPYIGQNALKISIEAGIIALILICIIMIFLYRLPGIVSSISLICYISLVILILANTGISMTLPGIAGLILSIGMAVDANVIIFERFKEELKNKVGPKKAFDRCYKNAMAAIIDGNVTTFIVAILLYIFGIGSIKGFGIVLAIGVVVSLLTAVVITKLILKQFIPLVSKSTFLFGIKKEVE